MQMTIYNNLIQRFRNDQDDITWSWSHALHVKISSSSLVHSQSQSDQREEPKFPQLFLFFCLRTSLLYQLTRSRKRVQQLRRKERGKKFDEREKDGIGFTLQHPVFKQSALDLIPISTSSSPTTISFTSSKTHPFPFTFLIVRSHFQKEENLDHQSLNLILNRANLAHQIRGFVRGD